MKTSQNFLRIQTGAALPVALVMLLISTMVGLASIRTATNQEKMSANMYDRSLAYQAAEEALRVAEESILNAANPEDDALSFDCLDLSKDCQPIPPSTFSDQSGAGDWKSISSALLKNKALLSGSSEPEYYIERIGLVGGTDELGVGSSANCDNYGGCDETPPSAMLFRVTARSGEPAKNKGRAIVALQTTIKKNL